MNILDIIGPVMVGPSSSHTAGAVKIGYVARKLMDEEISEVHIFLHGSFLATGKGHGTDKAIVAGLLGMRVDDMRIPDSFILAEKRGMKFTIEGIEMPEAHPNSVKLMLTGKSGRKLEIVGSSVGGGQIRICEIDGLKVSFSGDYPTLIVNNRDMPGQVTEISRILGQEGINIATMQLYRDTRGGKAVMVIECDQEVPLDSVKSLENYGAILKVTYLSLDK